MFVMQDGADFYIFSDKTGEDLLETQTAPMRVQDFDMDAANKARDWFVDQQSEPITWI